MNALADASLVKRKTNNQHYHRGGKYLDDSERIHFPSNSPSEDEHDSGPSKTIQGSKLPRTQSSQSQNSRAKIITYSKKTNALTDTSNKGKKKMKATNLKYKEAKSKVASRKPKSQRKLKKLSSEKHGKATGSMDVDGEWQGLNGLDDEDDVESVEAQESSQAESSDEEAENRDGFGPADSDEGI